MTMAVKDDAINGVVIGVLMGFSEGGEPLVVFPGNRSEAAVKARSTAALTQDHVGRDMALMFENGDPARPLIVGPIVKPEDCAVSPKDERTEHLELTASRDITLRCGKASLTLTRAGKILLRGAYIFSRSSGVNKIKGGSVQLN
ncbi:MAG: DUF6484 domain-containing protein [Pseudomonadota bacterium]